MSDSYRASFTSETAKAAAEVRHGDSKQFTEAVDIRDNVDKLTPATWEIIDDIHRQRPPDTT